MVDKIITLENDRKYLIVDKVILNNINYYYGTRLDDNDEPLNNYIFLEEVKDSNDVYMVPVYDEKLKGLLLTAFTVSFVNMAYDNV